MSLLSAHVSVRRSGLRWEVCLHGRCTLVPDSRGLRYLAVLTANAERDIPATTLASGTEVGDLGRAGAAQPVLDDTARREFKRRLSELDSAIARADAIGHQQRSEALAQEQEWLLRELAAAAGLGGRVRPFATHDERARVAVSKAIRRALDRIRQADPVIGEHLRRCVQTGRHCVYLPAR